MRRPPVEPSELVEPAPPLSQTIKSGTPHGLPLILNLFTIFYLTRPELPFIINKLFNSDSGIL